MPHDLKAFLSRSQVLGYVVAVGGVILATAATPLVAWITGGYVPPLLYVLVIVAAATIGGLLPGLLATALGTAAALVFLFEQDGFDIADPKDPIRLAFLVGTGVLVSWVLEFAFRKRRRIDEEREQLRVTLASIGDGVVRTDLAGNVTGLNAVAEALTGWKENEAIGRPLVEVFRIVNETTREEVENPALRALREGCIVGLANHTVLIAKDGFERPIEDSAAPIRDAEGTILGAVLVFRDVTRDRRAAQALRAIEARRAAMLDSAIDAIIAIDAAGEILDFNPAAERIFGYSRRDAVGREMAELIIPPARREAHRQGLGRFLSTGGEGRILNQRLELIAARKDGTEFPVEVSISPASIDGVPIFVGYLRDVSAAKRLDRERTFFADLAAQTQPLEDPQELTQTAARLLAEHLDVDRCAYAEVEDEQLFVITGDYTRGVPSIVGRWPVEDFGAECARSMLADEPYVVEDSEDDPRIGSQDLPAYRATSIRAVIYVPLHKRGRFTAAMAVHAKTPRKWTDHEIAFVLTVTNRCWEALERSRVVRRLRESEERYRSLVTATSAIVWDTPASGEFEGSQPSWTAFTGQTTRQLLGWGWLDAVHPDDRAETSAIWNRSVETATQCVLEHRLRRADGEYRRMSVRVVPIFDDSGAIREWVGVHYDVTESRATESALSDARERLATTLATAEVGTWEVDAQTQLVVADALLARMFGVPERQALAGEVMLERFLEAIHPDDRLRVEREIARSLEAGAPYEVEYRVQKEDQSIRWVIARGARLRPGHLAGVLIDVTERKRAQEAMLRSEERYRTLFETMDEGFCVADVLFDEEGRAVDYLFIEANPAFEKHSGLADVVGKTAAELVPGHESYWAEIYGEVVRTGRPVRFVNEAKMLDRWFDVNAFRIGGEGSVRVAQLFTDITERKRTEQERREYEERFRTLVEQVEDYAIFMIDPKGRPTSWNEGVLRVLGFDEEDFLGVDIARTIFLPEDIEEGIPERELKEAARTGSANNDRWMRRKDRVPFYAMGVTNALRDEGGELVGYLKVMRDQTERKQMEDELRRVNADLAQTDRRKDEFLATLAHELRNPLAPIRAGLDLLKLSADDPQETAEVVDVMERQAQQMMRLIDDLLEVSRITQGKLELRTCPVNLGDVMKSAVDAARPFVDEAGHTLSLSLPAEPIRLEADPHRLQQVFANLLNNAAKYTPEGGRIEIAAERQNGQALVRVRDDGIGIPPEMKDRIFEMFAQIDRSMERGYSGLGIGLTLVKRLVEMHGGQVEAHSEGAGRGSEFVVRLPVSDSSAKTDDGPAPAVDETSSGLKTLVADDSRPAADTLAKILRILGNEVRTAYDGREAVDAAEEWRPDVILMDLGMPRMNGYEATREIRSREWGTDVLIVALTGWGQEDDRRRTQEAGFDRHLVKPVEPATLRRIFSEARGSRTSDA